MFGWPVSRPIARCSRRNRSLVLSSRSAVSTLTATVRSRASLGAAVDDAETAAADLFSVVESGRAQLRDDGGAHVALRLEQIPILIGYPR